MENTTLQYIEDYLHNHGKRLKLPEEINGAIIVAIEEMLAAREARLVEALEHYANPTIWRIASEYVSEGYSDWYQPEQAHGFDVAAKALAEHRGEKANTEEKHDDG